MSIEDFIFDNDTTFRQYQEDFGEGNRVLMILAERTKYPEVTPKYSFNFSNTERLNFIIEIDSKCNIIGGSCQKQI